jgi:hypothetical protein
MPTRPLVPNLAWHKSIMVPTLTSPSPPSPTLLPRFKEVTFTERPQAIPIMVPIPSRAIAPHTPPMALMFHLNHRPRLVRRRRSLSHNGLLSLVFLAF